ncbi:MAG: hypothetical protein AAF125_21575, partial [Chloroflexota bacterium]
AARNISAELVVADLRTYEVPQNLDLLVAAYIIHLLPNPYDHLKAWQDAVRPGGIAVVSTRGRFPFDPPEYFFPELFEFRSKFEEAGWFILHAREEYNWRQPMNLHFRRSAVVAVKPE